MRTSPSQLVTALSCDRKWVFDKLFKLGDGKDPKARDIGTILHACCERFLAADDQGRVPQWAVATPEDPLYGQNIGDPVDLFPTGWINVHEWGKDTGRRIDLEAQAQCRILIKQAIENGTLHRPPNRGIEVHYEVPVDGVDDCTMQGYVDLDTPNVVEDHKTTKKKGYALSKAKLAKDPKMLCYAYFKWRQRQLDNSPLKNKPVTLRLNYFSKTQDREPWAVTACIKPQDVVNFWEQTVIPKVKRMAELAAAFKAGELTEDKWDTIDGPNDPKACEEYGGCPHARVCSRVSTIDFVRKSNERLQQQYLGKKPERKTDMSFFGKKKTGKKAAAKPATVSTNAAVQTGAAVAEAEAVVEETKATVPTDTPPWAVEGCKACGGKGFGKTGKPCKACDLVSGRTGGKTSSQFEIWVDDSGDTRWKEAGGQATEPARKEAAPEATEAPKADTPSTDTKKTTKAKASKKKATKTTKKTETTTVKVGDVERTDTKTLEIAESSQQEVATGFDLYIGCMPLGHPRTVTLAQILAKEGAELAKEKGANSYFELNAFERRDAVAAQATAIAEELKGVALICPGATITPDERNLLAALEPLAAYKVVTLV